MSTKHAPATPLPWSPDNGDSPEWGVFGPDGDAVAYADRFKECASKTDDENDQSDAIGADERNMAYAAHAANAYPTLVLMLSEAVKRDRDMWVNDARQLLRQLGEGA